jgi:hypothetical protein
MRNMKQVELEHLLSRLGSELYGFAFILIPDDLQAHQLVVDSVGAILISKRNYFESLMYIKKKFFENEEKYLRQNLYKNVYELSKKRFHQLKLSVIENQELGFFYTLDFDEKALLYLREKCRLTNDEISFVTSKNKQEVISMLYSARLKFIDKIPYSKIETNSNEVRI